MWGFRNRHNEAYYAELAGMEREYKMAEKEAQMRKPIMSGLTVIEAAQMLTKEVYEKPTKLYETVDTRLVRSLEKLGVIKFKEEQTYITYLGVEISKLTNKELVQYLRNEKNYETDNKAHEILLKEMSRRLGQ